MTTQEWQQNHAELIGLMRDVTKYWYEFHIVICGGNGSPKFLNYTDFKQTYMSSKTHPSEAVKHKGLYIRPYQLVGSHSPTLPTSHSLLLFAYIINQSGLSALSFRPIRYTLARSQNYVTNRPGREWKKERKGGKNLVHTTTRGWSIMFLYHHRLASLIGGRHQVWLYTGSYRDQSGRGQNGEWLAVVVMGGRKCKRVSGRKKSKRREKV